jgi:hypothetical protein
MITIRDSRFSVSRFPDSPGLNDSDRQIEGLEMRLVDVPTDQATREMHGFRVMNWGDILGYTLGFTIFNRQINYKWLVYYLPEGVSTCINMINLINIIWLMVWNMYFIFNMNGCHASH